MTDLQLECMRLWADKTLSFGCMIKWNFNRSYYIWDENRVFQYWDCAEMAMYTDEVPDYYEILGHPITRWRLCYLRQTDKSEDTVVNWVKQKMEKWINLCWNFENNPELYNQDILTRPTETQLLVFYFLLSIQ